MRQHAPQSFPFKDYSLQTRILKKNKYLFNAIYLL